MLTLLDEVPLLSVGTSTDDLEIRSRVSIMYFSVSRDARRLLVVALALVVGPSAARGQDGARSSREDKRDTLTIVNPNQLDIPEKRARTLLFMTCQLVAEEFHQKPKHVEIMMTLVLGAQDEHYSIDKKGRLTMHLARWDEAKFVNGVITSAIQWMASLQTRNQMLTEILRRTDQIVPVSANQLRRPAENSTLQTGGTYPTCISAVAMTPCSAVTRPPRP